MEISMWYWFWFEKAWQLQRCKASDTLNSSVALLSKQLKWRGGGVGGMERRGQTGAGSIKNNLSGFQRKSCSRWWIPVKTRSTKYRRCSIDLRVITCLEGYDMLRLSLDATRCQPGESRPEHRFWTAKSFVLIRDHVVTSKVLCLCREFGSWNTFYVPQPIEQEPDRRHPAWRWKKSRWSELAPVWSAVS